MFARVREILRDLEHARVRARLDKMKLQYYVTKNNDSWPKICNAMATEYNHRKLYYSIPRIVIFPTSDRSRVHKYYSGYLFKSSFKHKFSDYPSPTTRKI